MVWGGGWPSARSLGYRHRYCRECLCRGCSGISHSKIWHFWRLACPVGESNYRGSGRIPVGIAVDATGAVYIHDQYHFGIDKFSSSGSFVTRWGSWGLGIGLGGGHFYLPSGVAVDGKGYVYAIDSWNDTVQRFTSSGTVAGQWGSLGSGDGQFDYPVDIASDSEGNVYVADSRNVCIKKFTSSGTFITKWGLKGTGDGQFNYAPNTIAVDTSGNVYVGEGSRIQKLTSSGTFITKWGSYGSGDGQLACISGIAADSLGYVYITDSCNQIRRPGFHARSSREHGLVQDRLPDPPFRFRAFRHLGRPAARGVRGRKRVRRVHGNLSQDREERLDRDRLRQHGGRRCVRDADGLQRQRRGCGHLGARPRRVRQGGQFRREDLPAEYRERDLHRLYVGPERRRLPAQRLRRRHDA